MANRLLQARERTRERLHEEKNAIEVLNSQILRREFLKSQLTLTSVNYHRNEQLSILLNQRFALTTLRATAPDFFFLFAIYASHPSKISVLDKSSSIQLSKVKSLPFPLCQNVKPQLANTTRTVSKLLCFPQCLEDLCLFSATLLDFEIRKFFQAPMSRVRFCESFPEVIQGVECCHFYSLSLLSTNLEDTTSSIAMPK